MEITPIRQQEIETVLNSNDINVSLRGSTSDINIDVKSEDGGIYVALSGMDTSSIEVTMPISEGPIHVICEGGLNIEGSFDGGMEVMVCLDAMFGHTHDGRYYTKESSDNLISEAERRSEELTERTFEQAQEAQEMLKQSLLTYFTESISPISVQTMSLLAGAEELQYRYVTSKTTPTVTVDGIYWDNETKNLVVPEGGIIQHMTLGIASITSERAASSYKFWNMREYYSGALSDGAKKYWLYAQVRRTGETSPVDMDGYLISETALAFEDNNVYPTLYNLLVGLLSSETNDNRSWVTMYGFTEILPGRITTDKIVSPSGKTYFDLSVGDGEGEIGGKIRFVNTGGTYTDLAGTVDGLQSQIDGQIIAWFQEHDPTLANYPANEWTTDALKDQHLNDTFTNLSTGGSWRFTKVGSVYSWVVISDTATQQALIAAGLAQDTADGKKRVFTTTPTTPYDLGDLWSGLSAGDLKVCTTARASGSYVAGDWVLASKYTDDSTAIAAALVGNPNLIPNGFRMATGNGYPFDQQDNIVYLTAGKTYTFSARGRVVSGSGTKLWVYIFENTWASQNYIEITETSLITKKAIFVPTITGHYHVFSYNNPAAVGECYTEWVMLQEGDVYVDQNTTFKQTSDEEIANQENLLENSVSRTFTAGPSENNHGINLAAVDYHYLFPTAQIVLLNGHLYTLTIGNSTLSSGSTYDIGLFNTTDWTWAGTTLDVHVNVGEKWSASFRVPNDGDNWVLRVFAGNWNATGGKTITLSNVMLQKGPFSTPWKPCLKALTEAMQGSTDVIGGLILTNLIMLKNAFGAVTAGISGMDDNITLWGGGTHEQAVTAEEGGTPLPVLLTKLGAGSNIGCLKVVDKDTVQINNGAFVVLLTTKTIAQVSASLETVTLQRIATLSPVDVGNNTFVSGTLTKTATYNRFISPGSIVLTVSYGSGYTNFGEDFMLYLVVNGTATQIGSTLSFSGLNPNGDTRNGSITIPHSVLDFAASAGHAVSLRLSRISYSEGGTPGATATFENCKIEFAEVSKQMIIANDGFCVSKDSKNVFKLYGDGSDLALSFKGKIGTTRGTLGVDSGTLKLT